MLTLVRSVWAMGRKDKEDKDKAKKVTINCTVCVHITMGCSLGAQDDKKQRKVERKAKKAARKGAEPISLIDASLPRLFNENIELCTYWRSSSGARVSLRLCVLRVL